MKATEEEAQGSLYAGNNKDGGTGDHDFSLYSMSAIASHPASPPLHLRVWDYPVLVLLGLNVAKAFGIPNPVLLSTVVLTITTDGTGIASTTIATTNECSVCGNTSGNTTAASKSSSGLSKPGYCCPISLTCLVFPHPSSVSHHWNTDENCRRAAMELKKALGLIGGGGRKEILNQVNS